MKKEIVTNLAILLAGFTIFLAYVVLWGWIAEKTHWSIFLVGIVIFGLLNYLMEKNTKCSRCMQRTKVHKRLYDEGYNIANIFKCPHCGNVETK